VGRWATRDWRAGATPLCVAAGWLTWFPFASRTKFDYYSMEFEPFLILCIVPCFGLILSYGLLPYQGWLSHMWYYGLI
jgi:dolichyl-phosphate-mannose-protein mannosyltransferase